MKRIIILEKVGDYLRQYWLLPMLDYPVSPTLLDKIIEHLVKHKRIDVIQYDKNAKVQVIPWIWNEGIIDKETGNTRPASRIFPYPRFDIKSMTELEEYNRWLLTEFKKIVMKMNNSTHLEPGWETIKSEYVTELNPIEVDITQYELDRLEYLIGAEDNSTK